MLSYRDILNGLKYLQIEPDRPIIAHASLSAFGEVRGGAGTLLGALLTAFNAVMMPAFTYKTMLVPEHGPEENALGYGDGKDLNRMAEFYHAGMPADPLMGVMAEKLRLLPHAYRSNHPILSFTGVGVNAALKTQINAHPLAPVGALASQGGWVLLLGVDHTANTSIHYGEHLAGRKQFVRWALTPRGVQECPGYPGCSDGFEALSGLVAGITRKVKIGRAQVRALPLEPMLETVQLVIKSDPLALLCNRPACERCDAVRQAVRGGVYGSPN